MKFFKLFFAAFLGCLISGLVVFFISLFTIIGVVGSAASSKAVVVEPESILKIDLSEIITDAPQSNPFAAFNYSTMEMYEAMTMLSALRAIEVAADDDNIKGIYINTNPMAMVSSANLEELRAAIVSFKEKSGKFVIAYNDTYTQAGYYLSSVADKVYAQPEGMLTWQGIATQSLFFKGLLDKLDVSVEIFRPTVCKYKSAVEPFFLSEMSPANRQQNQALINSMWSTIAGDVAASRNMSFDQVNALASNLSCMDPKDALKEGMIDGVIYEDELLDIFEEKGVEIDDDEPNYVTLGEYASTCSISKSESFSGEKIGIVYAEGDITDGEGTDAKVYGDITAATIRKARLDDDIEAVVLRVNSPGGSALASDVMWRELELLRKEKPLIVSMGGMAASGGYYISAPADVIVANKLTLTGSIGVFGMLPNVEGALKSKLGITTDGVKTNESAGFMTSFSPLTSFEKSKMIKSVDKVYERFTSLVAEGRNLPLEKVLDIAQGRVWSGTEAVEIGLADQIGGLREAVAIAASKAGIEDNYRVVEVLNTPTGFAALFSDTTASIKSAIAKWSVSSQLGSLYEEYAEIQNSLSVIDTDHGMIMYSPYKVEL